MCIRMAPRLFSVDLSPFLLHLFFHLLLLLLHLFHFLLCLPALTLETGAYADSAKHTHIEHTLTFRHIHTHTVETQ